MSDELSHISIEAVVNVIEYIFAEVEAAITGVGSFLPIWTEDHRRKRARASPSCAGQLSQSEYPWAL